MYNSYDDLIIKLKLGTEKSQILYAHLSKYVNNINSITSEEIHFLLNDNFFKNQMLLNYLYTQYTATSNAYDNCVKTLELINKE